MFLWIDIETTGLDTNDDILEIACIMTTPDLQPIFEREYVIHYDGCTDKMSDWVRETHTRTGLFDKAKQSRTTILDAEDDLLKEIGIRDGFIMAGNSIHFDRGFIKKKMPRLFEKFHYRVMDVSSIRIFFDNIPPYEKKRQHSAKQDILESIQEFRYYKTLKS
jgi:oligoribonuclease